jgi:hypothetical protein
MIAASGCLTWGRIPIRGLTFVNLLVLAPFAQALSAHMLR